MSSGSSDPSMWMCSSAFGMARSSEGRGSADTGGPLNIAVSFLKPVYQSFHGAGGPASHETHKDCNRFFLKKKGRPRAALWPVHRLAAYFLSPPGTLPSTPLT